MSGGIANGTCVWTPTGFMFIENLRVGDSVIGGDGHPCTVTGVDILPMQRCLTLMFDRGVSIRCSPNQQWLALHPAARFPTRHSHGKEELNPRFNRWAVLCAQAMLDASGPNPKPRRRFLIPAAGVAQMQSQEVPIDPYLLGVLLGDGCFRKKSTSISSADQQLIDWVKELLPVEISMRKANKYDYCLVLPGGKGHGQGGRRAVGGNPLTKALRNLGLHGLLSGDKFVPETYLFNSPAVRLALLQGLMDTDGGVAPQQGTIEFSSTSWHLAGAVEFLVASFGGKSASHGRITQFTDKYGQRKDGAPSFRVRMRLPQVTPFRLTRKVERLVRPVSTCDERVIQSIEEGGACAMTSIKVDHPNHTFLIDKGVVVHDSTVPQLETDYSSVYAKICHTAVAKPILHL